MTTNADALPQLVTIDQRAEHLGSSPRYYARACRPLDVSRQAVAEKLAAGELIAGSHTRPE